MAEQSANGTLQAAQRKSLDLEGQALRNEYNRIVATTQFNGSNLFSVGASQTVIEAGGSTISLALTKLNTQTTGDGTFLAATQQGGTPAAKTSVLGDLNGDGVLDIVSGQYNGGQVYVLLGNGDGSFLSEKTYGSPPSAIRSMATGDVNGDGKLDIINALFDGTVQIELGNGDGTLRAGTTFLGFSATSTTGLTTADFDHNGTLDLAIVADQDNSLFIFSGNGNGTFKASRSYSAGVQPLSIVNGDVNNDGNLDVYIGTNSSGAGVLLGNSDGSFSLGNYALGSSVALQDLNGDGNLDQIGGNGGSMSVRLGNGDGNFKSPSAYTITSPYSPVFGDFNGDGYIDAASDFSGAEYLCFGNGDGSFKSPTSFAIGTGDNGTLTGDFNGDGALDLFTNGSYGHNVQVIMGNSVDNPYLQPFSLKSQTGAKSTLVAIKNALNSVSLSIGQMGASQSRLNTALANLQQAKLQYDGAASQITDVDVASESANLVRRQILQQADAGILAQANQQPALVLRLLANLG